MSWLTLSQLPGAVSAGADGKEDLTMIVKVCLATGARWGEAERFTTPHPYKLTFTKTKGKKNRTVPIPKWLYDELSVRQGRMFKPAI